MLKQTLTTLFLCLSFGAFSCTDKNDGLFPEGEAAGGPSGPIVGPGDADVGNVEGTEAPVVPSGNNVGNPPEPVPEPMTMLLFGSGLAGVAYRYRRRRQQHEAAGETKA